MGARGESPTRNRRRLLGVVAIAALVALAAGWLMAGAGGSTDARAATSPATDLTTTSTTAATSTVTSSTATSTSTTSSASCAAAITTVTSGDASTTETGPTGPTGPSGPTGASGATGGPTYPSAGHPCWTAVSPYPFGVDGNPVTSSSVAPIDNVPCLDADASEPGTATSTCFLYVTSMDFRAYNRGLAATTPVAQSTTTNPFGVWTYNGSSWSADQTFPGSQTCPGSVIVWAGKLDYWLIGPSAAQAFSGPWPTLCRFDGSNLVWQEVPVPQAVTAAYPGSGAITSASCFAWDNCWFFGSYGTILHWDGAQLIDESPAASEGWLQTGFTAAVAQTTASGAQFGVAVGDTSATSGGSALPTAPDGSPPPQVYTSSGGAFTPFAFTPPTLGLAGDPYRTDLVATDFAPDGSGWLAGNPAGLQASASSPTIRYPSTRPGPPAGTTLDPSPLITIDASGGPSSCAGPPANRFGWTAGDSEGILWSSISTFPDTDNAIAGGELWPSPASNPASAGPLYDKGDGEPVIVDAQCDGTTTTTRFTIPDPTAPGPTGDGHAPGALAPADLQSDVTAVAANAFNDAWASTGEGTVNWSSVGNASTPPSLYHLTDAQPPAAAPGDDDEPARPTDVDVPPAPPPASTPPTIVIQTPAPAAAPVAAKLTPSRDLPASLYDIRSKIRGHGRTVELYLTFKLRRPITLGAEALRGRRVVASARLRTFTGASGEIVLRLNAKDYPTALRFTTDAPTVTLDSTGSPIAGPVNLFAAARPYRGHRITSVVYQYSPAGQGLWYTIGTASVAPWKVAFSTSAVTPGRYDLRAVATDNGGVSGVSPVALVTLLASDVP